MRKLWLVLLTVAVAGLYPGLVGKLYAHANNTDPNVIHACVQQERGEAEGHLRIVPAVPRDRDDNCRPREVAMHWNISGSQGPKGDKGDQGLQGLQGLQGAKGDQGLQGSPGAKGDKGDKGLQGIQGIQGPQGQSVVATCSQDSVLSGITCIDTYEASVWKTTDASVIEKIRFGTVTLADLTAAGAAYLGVSIEDYVNAGCPKTGNGCMDVYAVSISGVKPSQFINWFQASAVARNSGKRLPTNAEWQAAALGTPDTADCNFSSSGPALTGALTKCVSNVGAFDMVGNLWEWVADWVPLSTVPGETHCAAALFSGTGDDNCLVGASTSEGPGALIRGGAFNSGTKAGVFAVFGGVTPDYSNNADPPVIGFRAAR